MDVSCVTSKIQKNKKITTKFKKIKIVQIITHFSITCENQFTFSLLGPALTGPGNYGIGSNYFWNVLPY